MSRFGIAKQLNISSDEAGELRTNYFKRFGRVGRFLRGVLKQAHQDGYTETIFGRRRVLPDLDSPNRVRREAAERAALNAPIQGTAADIIKIAMINIHRRLREEMKTRMLLQVHDEIILEVATGEREAAERVLVEEMSGAASCVFLWMCRSAGVSLGRRRVLGSLPCIDFRTERQLSSSFLQAGVGGYAIPFLRSCRGTHPLGRSALSLLRRGEHPRGYPDVASGGYSYPSFQPGASMRRGGVVRSDIRVPEAKRGRVPCRNEDEHSPSHPSVTKTANKYGNPGRVTIDDTPGIPVHY